MRSKRVTRVGTLKTRFRLLFYFKISEWLGTWHLSILVYIPYLENSVLSTDISTTIGSRVHLAIFRIGYVALIMKFYFHKQTSLAPSLWLCLFSLLRFSPLLRADLCFEISSLHRKQNPTEFRETTSSWSCGTQDSWENKVLSAVHWLKKCHKKFLCHLFAEFD